MQSQTHEILVIKYFDMFSYNIKSMRERAKLTRLDIAKKLKISIDLYSKYEAYPQMMYITSVIRLAQILNCELIDLLPPIYGASKSSRTTPSKRDC